MKKLGKLLKLFKAGDSTSVRELPNDRTLPTENHSTSFSYTKLQSDSQLFTIASSDFEDLKSKGEKKSLKVESTSSGSCSPKKHLLPDKDLTKNPISGRFQHFRSKTQSGVISIDDLSTNEDNFLKSINDRKDLNKPKSNVYLINISNSRNFLVGSQKTINVGDSKRKIDKSTIEYQMDNEVMQELLDSEEKLNEDNIAIISIHLGDQWKALGESLGLKESFLNELEVRNESNQQLIVYDYLQNYIHEFPDTSLGFIISLLHKCDQINVIQKLAAS